MTSRRQKRSGRLALLFSFITLSAFLVSTAWAGKKEREYNKKYVKPAIAAAKKAYKTHCGCDLKVVVDPELTKSTGALGTVRGTANSIADNMEKFCSDEDSKKVACSMKTIKLAKKEPTGFVFEGSTGTANSDGNLYIAWDQIAKVIDP